MKKLSTLTALLLAATLVFMGCKQQADDKSDPYSDCSETVTSIELADGTWTLTASDSGDMGFPYTSEATYKITASSGNYNVISGTTKMSMKTKDVLRENYSEYVEMSAAEKNLFKQEFLNQVKYMIPSYMGTISEADMNDQNIIIVFELSQYTLSTVAAVLNPANLSSACTVKTNSDKTKYVITVPTDEKTYTYYVTKD